MRFYDSTYYIGNDSGNWMGSLFREDDGPWRFEHRFRYYKDNKAFDSEDTKNWYTMTAKPDIAPEEAVANMKEAIAKLKPTLEKQYDSTLDTIELNCRNDDPKFFFEIASRPWAQVKMLKPEESARILSEREIL